MSEYERNNFVKHWSATEVIREYQPMLFTFGAMELPYVLIAEHKRLQDRAVVFKGFIVIQKPHILLPSYLAGPQFKDGFEHANAIPEDALYLLRCLQVPYSQISHRPIVTQHIEYGRVQDVIEMYNNKLESEEDSETGLIKGTLDGTDICLMRYSMGLAIKSAPGNVKEFFEHLRRRRAEPIRPDEKITDEDIRKLFE